MKKQDKDIGKLVDALVAARYAIRHIGKKELAHGYTGEYLSEIIDKALREVLGDKNPLRDGL